MQFRLQEVDEALDLLRPCGVLDTGVDVLGVFAEHHHIGERGVLHGRGDAREVADRPHAGVEIERLTHHDIQGADAAADRRTERAFDGHDEFAQGLQRLVREPGPTNPVRLLAGVDLHPLDASCTAIGALDGRIDHLAHHRGDVDADAIAFDEGDDRPVWHGQTTVGVDSDPGALRRQLDMFVSHDRGPGPLPKAADSTRAAINRR